MTANPPGHGFRSGFIVLAGLPNAGKSTLINKLAGGNIAIVSPKPQTTRQNIIAIKTETHFQAVYVDTPGFLLPRYGLQKTMRASAMRAAREDADVLCLLAEPAMPGEAELDLCSRLGNSPVPKFLAINKVDTLSNRAGMGAIEAAYNAALKFEKTLRVSALTGENVPELELLLTSRLPENPPYFPDGQWTDRWERFFVAEFIREQIFLNCRDEVPYSCAVEIAKFHELKDAPDSIEAFIHVEKESQKPILIGKGGSGVKRLREGAQKSIEKFLGRRVALELKIKVSPDWRDNPAKLKQFGYID